MKWKKIALETTTEAVDLVSDLLNELGIDGIEIEDNLGISEEDRKKMFIDILPELPPDEGKATVTFYLDEDENIDAKLAEVKAGLLELDTFVDTGAKTFTVSGNGKTGTVAFTIGDFDLDLVKAGGWVSYADARY